MARASAALRRSSFSFSSVWRSFRCSVWIGSSVFLAGGAWSAGGAWAGGLSRHGHDHERGGEQPADAAHASGRPRASSPPTPPSRVPASISVTMFRGRRNASRATPSTSLTSGSSRGPRSA